MLWLILSLICPVTFGCLSGGGLGGMMGGRGGGGCCPIPRTCGRSMPDCVDSFGSMDSLASALFPQQSSYSAPQQQGQCCGGDGHIDGHAGGGGGGGRGGPAQPPVFQAPLPLPTIVSPGGVTLIPFPPAKPVLPVTPGTVAPIVSPGSGSTTKPGGQPYDQAIVDHSVEKAGDGTGDSKSVEEGDDDEGDDEATTPDGTSEWHQSAGPGYGGDNEETTKAPQTTAGVYEASMGPIAPTDSGAYIKADVTQSPAVSNGETVAGYANNAVGSAAVKPHPLKPEYPVQDMGKVTPDPDTYDAVAAVEEYVEQHFGGTDETMPPDAIKGQKYTVLPLPPIDMPPRAPTPIPANGGGGAPPAAYPDEVNDLTPTTPAPPAYGDSGAGSAYSKPPSIPQPPAMPPASSSYNAVDDYAGAAPAPPVFSRPVKLRPGGPEPPAIQPEGNYAAADPPSRPPSGKKKKHKGKKGYTADPPTTTVSPTPVPAKIFSAETGRPTVVVTGPAPRAKPLPSAVTPVYNYGTTSHWPKHEIQVIASDDDSGNGPQYSQLRLPDGANGQMAFSIDAETPEPEYPESAAPTAAPTPAPQPVQFTQLDPSPKMLWATARPGHRAWQQIYDQKRKRLSIKPLPDQPTSYRHLDRLFKMSRV